MHADAHAAPHGDAVDQRHVRLAQAGDEVVEAVLLVEEPAGGGVPKYDSCLVGNQEGREMRWLRRCSW